jgi:phage baseplate assembly protein V
MWDSPETNRHKQTLSRGVVSDRKNDPKRGPLVRVTWLDTGKTSDWYPVLQRNTLGSKDFHCFRKGERVVVLREPTGNEAGVVIGATYNSQVKTPTVSNLDSRHVIFDDGTYVTYDPGSHTMTVNTQGPINMTTTGAVSVTAQGNVTVNTQGNANVTASGTATVQATTITLQGNVHVTGTLLCDGFATFSAGGTANPKIVNQDGSGGGS